MRGLGQLVQIAPSRRNSASASHSAADGPVDHSGLALRRVVVVVLAVITAAVADAAATARIARDYSPPDGGIAFGDEPPDYGDFASLALTIGM